LEVWVRVSLRRFKPPLEWRAGDADFVSLLLLSIYVRWRNQVVKLKVSFYVINLSPFEVNTFLIEVLHHALESIESFEFN
jgi:hypothetical protein